VRVHSIGGRKLQVRELARACRRHTWERHAESNPVCAGGGASTRMPVVVRRRAAKKNVVFDELKAIGDLNEHRDFILLQGQILKRGAHENDAFLSRWVEVKPRQITYSKFQNTKVIDQIEIDELIGIATMGWQDDTADELVEPNGSPRANEALSPPASFSFEGLKKPRTPSKKARNSVFWRFKSDMMQEKKQAFVYKLGPYDVALFTSPIGFHRGRTFVFRCEDMESRERWTETISRLLNVRLEKPVKATTAFFNIRKRVRSTYIGDYCQIGVATLIGVIACACVMPAATRPTLLSCLQS